jgi:hypothetical protein
MQEVPGPLRVQRLKGSQRAHRVRSTPITGRNVATQRFSALGPKAVVALGHACQWKPASYQRTRTGGRMLSDLTFTDLGIPFALFEAPVSATTTDRRLAVLG